MNRDVLTFAVYMVHEMADVWGVPSRKAFAILNESGCSLSTVARKKSPVMMFAKWLGKIITIYSKRYAKYIGLNFVVHLQCREENFRKNNHIIIPRNLATLIYKNFLYWKIYLSVDKNISQAFEYIVLNIWIIFGPMVLYYWCSKSQKEIAI